MDECKTLPPRVIRRVVILVALARCIQQLLVPLDRGLHSFTFQLNASAFCVTGGV